MSSGSRQAQRHPERHRPSASSLVAGVVIGYCHPGTVDGLFCDSLMGVLMNDHANHARVLRHGGFAAISSGPRIASARTQVVDAFLRHSAQPEWLWFVDADMVFPADTLERLLDVADPDTHPIVGGLCFGGGRGGQVFPTLYTLTGDGAKLGRVLDYPADALVKVNATGTACLLIHRSVLLRMAEVYSRPYPWFAESVIDGHEYGEDITFCLRAGAMTPSIPIHVHTGVQVGHVKPSVIDERAFLAHRARVDEIGEEGVVAEHAQRIGLVARR